MENDFEKKKETLKTIRNKLLKFHKVLMDAERDKFELEFGKVSPGKFLELLLSDERFAWLRTISTLIVKIDESFDLNDGMSNEMLIGFYTEIKDLFDEDSNEYNDFKFKLNQLLPNLAEARKLRDEIITLH